MIFFFQFDAKKNRQKNYVKIYEILYRVQWTWNPPLVFIVNSFYTIIFFLISVQRTQCERFRYLYSWRKQFLRHFYLKWCFCPKDIIMMTFLMRSTFFLRKKFWNKIFICSDDHVHQHIRWTCVVACVCIRN